MAFQEAIAEYNRMVELLQEISELNIQIVKAAGKVTLVMVTKREAPMPMAPQRSS